MDWHPRAIRVPYADAGAFTGGGDKLLWHTTEGFGLPAYSGSAPHFTLNPRTGQLWQHIALSRTAKALMHPPGTAPTNSARTRQVELIGRAAETQGWTRAEYARIAALARWIESNAGVPRRCTVKFTSTPSRQASRLGQQEFIRYSGHLGHEHAASNLHWDPGRFRIDLVLGQAVKDPGHGGPALRRGDSGPHVEQAQRWLNRAGWNLHVDGDFGPATAHAVAIYKVHHDIHPRDEIIGERTWHSLRRGAENRRSP